MPAPGPISNTNLDFSVKSSLCDAACCGSPGHTSGQGGAATAVDCSHPVTPSVPELYLYVCAAAGTSYLHSVSSSQHFSCLVLEAQERREPWRRQRRRKMSYSVRIYLYLDSTAFSPPGAHLGSFILHSIGLHGVLSVTCGLNSALTIGKLE